MKILLLTLIAMMGPAKQAQAEYALGLGTDQDYIYPYGDKVVADLEACKRWARKVVKIERSWIQADCWETNAEGDAYGPYTSWIRAWTTSN